MLLRHVRRDDLAIVNEQTGLPLYKFAEAPIAAGDLGDQIIHNQKRGCSHDPAGKRGVRAGHRILNRI